MGAGSHPNNVLVFLAALEQCLMSQKVAIAPGAGVAAANQEYLGAA
jgi:alanine-glyoxylate transaminase/serine-glyoxylate transaminase/serine-pyruvate transaminase